MRDPPGDVPDRRDPLTPPELELKAMEIRFRLYRTIVFAVSCILVTLSTALPLLVLRDAVEPFAGRTTKVEANIAVALTVTGSLTVTGLVAAKGQQRKRSLVRLRDRLEETEDHR